MEKKEDALSVKKRGGQAQKKPSTKEEERGSECGPKLKIW